MVSALALNEALDVLAQLKFFPSEPGTRAEIGNLIGRMCANDTQVCWLAARAVALFNEWPGPLELRAVYCSKFTPLDGFEVHSTVYPDGVPSENPNWAGPKILTAAEQKKLLGAVITPELEAPPRARLLPGQIASNDAQSDKLVARVIQHSRIPRPQAADLEAIRHLYPEEEYQAAQKKRKIAQCAPGNSRVMEKELADSMAKTPRKSDEEREREIRELEANLHGSMERVP